LLARLSGDWVVRHRTGYSSLNCGSIGVGAGVRSHFLVREMEPGYLASWFLGLDAVRMHKVSRQKVELKRRTGT